MRWSDCSKFTPQDIKFGFIDIRQVKTGDPVSIPVHDYVKTIIEKYNGKAMERSVNLRLIPNPNLPHASGDLKSLERALMALVDNAIKFSPKGGDVIIRLNSNSDSIHVAVEDHGIGIAKENRPRIFDRFYHLEKHEDNLFSGIGLGLAITRQVITQHQGSLELDSEPGKGTTFTMILPKWNSH